MADPSESMASWMAGLTFYRQRRMDGGLRTGIMLGESTVLGHFEEGGEDYDPSLLWSIDLRCDGPTLPSSAEGARQWLLAHESIIKDGFERYAEHLRAGSDPTGAFLLEWADFPNRPQDVAMKIVCGAMRRIDALSLARELRFIGENWRSLIVGLAANTPAVY
jgi:hypothetical protein